VSSSAESIGRRAVKELIPPGTRHLLRTEFNLVRSDGVAKAFRFNRMLADAWLRNLINRGRYTNLSDEQAVRARTSDTVFVFGSGYSLNSISAAEWAHIRQHDVFGFNAFYYERWIPVRFHLLRGGIYGELRWRGFAGEVVDAIRSNPLYRDTVFVVGCGISGIVHDASGYGLFPPAKGSCLSRLRAPGRMPTDPFARTAASRRRLTRGELRLLSNWRTSSWSRRSLRLAYLAAGRPDVVDRERDRRGSPVNAPAAIFVKSTTRRQRARRADVGGEMFESEGLECPSNRRRC
jgi:hypothetical protein